MTFTTHNLIRTVNSHPVHISQLQISFDFISIALICDKRNCRFFSIHIYTRPSSPSPSHLKLRDDISPSLSTHLPLALCHPLAFKPNTTYISRDNLTSVMYPAVPSIVGTRITYANEIHAVRLVQRKYLWRLTIMSDSTH
jgi:hypothetical protein